MHNLLFIAIIGGLGGMFGWGFADFAAKKTVDKIGSVASLVWAHLFGTGILLFIAIFDLLFLKNSLKIPTNSMEWLGLAFFGTLQTVVYLFVYNGFEKGQIAILSPIFASFAGLVALISVLFFGEVLTFGLIISLIVIFCGIMLLNTDPSVLHTKKLKIVGAPGVREVGIAALLATIWTLGWDKFTHDKDWVLYALLMYAFMTLSAYVISKFQNVDLSDVKSGAWKFLLLIGLGEAIAYLALSLGYSSTPYTSVIALLSGAFSVPTIILARIFLKEKVNTLQTIGSIVVIVGIITLALR